MRKQFWVFETKKKIGQNMNSLPIHLAAGIFFAQWLESIDSMLESMAGIVFGIIS